MKSLPVQVGIHSFHTTLTVSRFLESQIGWIFKSKANDSYCLYDSGPMVQHYALNYGFHTFPNLLKNLL